MFVVPTVVHYKTTNKGEVKDLPHINEIVHTICVPVVWLLTAFYTLDLTVCVSTELATRDLPGYVPVECNYRYWFFEQELLC